MSDVDDVTRDGDVRGKRHLSERANRRKESNRKSAREFRRRKKEKLDTVIQECDRLEEENRRIRLQLRVGTEADNLFEEEQKKHVAELQGLLRRAASDHELHLPVDRFVLRFTDVGLDRSSAVEFHLQQIERLLTDDLFTSISAHSLIGCGGKDHPAKDESTRKLVSNLISEFVPEGSSEKTVHDFLREYLCITPQQAQALREEGVHLSEMQDAVFAPLKVINAIRRKRGLVVLGLMELFTQVKKEMPPSHAAAFMAWTCQNAACMHMLNELWGKIYKRSSSGQRVSAFDVASNIDDMDEFDDDEEADGIDNNSDFELDDADEEENDDLSL